MEQSRYFLKFSELWEKLTRLEVGYEFTTIRGPDKFQFYYDRMKYADPLCVLLTEKKQNPVRMCIVKVIEVKSVRISELTDQQLKDDTYQYWTRNTFIVALRKWYKNKPWWEEGKSKMTYIKVKVVRMMI